MKTEQIINIERQVLATFIFDPKRLIEVEETLKIDDFYHPFHKAFFSVLLKLYENDLPIDEEFVKNELEKIDQFDELFFLNILSSTPIANLDVYIKEIKSHSQKLKIDELALIIREKIQKEENLANIINFFETKIENIQKGFNYKESKTLLDIINSTQEPSILYSTGIDFLDEVLDGGFETGQLVTITGEQESGKTQLVNQILFNVAKGFKCLYFSLEFNERQLAQYTKKKIKNCNIIDKRIFENIQVITDEMHTGQIDDILLDIKKEYRKNGVKFVVIDSQMMLYEDDTTLKYATSEERITSIFRKLHSLSKKLDILIILIAQSSKEDNKSKKVEIFGSKKAAHLARIMIHINYDKQDDIKNSTGKREIFIAKNKQNGKIASIEVFFNKDKLEFYSQNKQEVEEEENSFFDDTFVNEKPIDWKKSYESFLD